MGSPGVGKWVALNLLTPTPGPCINKAGKCHTVAWGGGGVGSVLELTET